MYLKQLELIGFKSFAERTRLDFGPGITAVVGPNGCGKCVHGSTRVLLESGENVSIQELVDNAIKNSKRIEILEDGFSVKENPFNIKVFSLNLETLKIETKPISAFVKRRSPEFILRVKTKTGREILTTHYHPFFAIKDGYISNLEASQLKPRTPVAMPRRLEVNGGSKEIDFLDSVNKFSIDDLVYLPYSLELMNAIRNACEENGGINKLSLNTGVAYHNIRSIFEGQSVNIWNFSRMANYIPQTVIDNIPRELKSRVTSYIRIPEKLDKDLARFLGYLISEGRNTYSSQVWFVNNDEDIIKDYCACAKSVFGVDPKIFSYKEGRKDIIIFSQVLCKYLDKVFGFRIDQGSKDKEIPRQLFSAPLDVVSEFISALFEGDGYISYRKQKGRKNYSAFIEYTTASERLAKGLCSLLLRFDVRSVIREKYKCATNTKNKTKKKYYSVYIYGQANLKNLINHLNFVGCKRENLVKVKKLEIHSNPNVDLVPNTNEVVKRLCKTSGLKIKPIRKFYPKLAAYYENRCSASRDGLKEVVRVVEKYGCIEDEKVKYIKNYLQSLATSDIFWDEIVEIEKVDPPEWVYDLCIEKNHNFIANDFIVHNTNIVDAIKWSLGEQSAKSLRGSSMEDVIFHGTDERKGIGMAEVSVTFDNSDKRIPLEFSEITATRRVFRSGESQYFVNKNLCRLKDVDEIFMDTGIGMRAYSVFEQGKMDLILSSRPEERRFVFEEAAGISKYKEHKRETLRKLEVTETNLVRLNDIIKEVQRQLNSIERAAAKARRYKNVQEELKEKEIKLLVYQLRNLQKDLARFEEDKSINEQQAAKMHEAIDSKDNRLGELRKSIREIDSQMSAIQDEKIKVETQLVSNKHEAEYKRNKIRELQERRDRVDSELEQLNKNLSEFRNSLEEIQKELSGAENTKIDYKNRLNNKYNTIKTIEVKTNELAGQIDSKKDLLVGKTAMQSHIKNEVSNIDLELRSISLKERRDSVELIKKKKEQEELLRKLEKLENVLEIQRKSLLGIRQKIKDNEEKVVLLKDEVANINKVLVTKQQYFTEKHKEYEILSNEKRLRSILENKDEFSGVIGLVSDLVTAKEEYSAAKTQWVVVDSLENARKAAELLQAENESQIMFLVLESLQDTEGLKNVAVRRKDLALDELKVILNNLSGEILELTERYNLSKGTLEQEEKLLEAARNNLYNEEIALSVDENDFLRLKSMHDSLCEEIKLLELDGQVEVQEHEELNVTRSRKEAELVSASDELKLLYSEIEKLQGLLKETNNRKEKEDREYTELKISLVSAEEKENLTEFKKHQIEKQIETTTDMISRLSSEKEENRAMIERLTTEISGLEKLVGDVSRRSIEISEQYESIKIKRKGTEEELVQGEEILRNEREMYDEVYSQFNERQLRLGEIRIKIDNIMQRLQNEYKISHEALEGLSLEGIFIEVLEQDIVTLRSKLDSMGEVSLVAIEEQDELVKRHEFLSTQRDDLVNAKDTLLKTIAKLNATSRRLFWDTFCQIRENFNKIFCQLFDGGKADLILVDESNILESGIEIIARPPGKRLQNVSLLSGGEKALTALALLFSIFKVKPSPFCIMDEIDAPLDDSNIDRFVELLKEFSQMSQFIIVTHNKRTISASNAMYGITMQESGVSRVVSVKLTASSAAR